MRKNNFFGGGVPYPIFFCANLLVRVKLGYPPNFNFLGKPLLGEKYVHGKKKERKKKKNNAKFSGHYVYPRTETVRAHALRSHQHINKEHKIQPFACDLCKFVTEKEDNLNEHKSYVHEETFEYKNSP